MISGSKILMKKNKNSRENGAMTFENGFHEFLKYCEIKNLREKTMKNYQEHYHKFIEYINNHTTYHLIEELTQYDIDNYIIYLKNSNMRDTSVNCYLRGIRAILNFWINNKQCEQLKVHIHKADKIAKETYTDEELYKLLQKPNINNCDFTTYRNWCIVNFLLATGVRVTTLVNIKIQDLDFSFDRILLTYTKNRRSYLIPMSGQLKHVLTEYLSFRKGSAEEYLFCNQYGEQMTADSVKHAIYKYNHKHGVERTSLHAFRHTFAKKCVMNGVNVFVLQRLMGHSDLSVTREYIDLYANDLAYNIENYNPLDTLGQGVNNKVVQKGKNKNKREKIRINI